jgi:multiple antibiotic resistance protein
LVEDALLRLDLLLFSQAFLTLFAIFDPVGALPFFASLTSSMDQTERKRVINRSCAVAFAILVFFAYVGLYMFQLMKITLGDLKVVGGIILLIFAVDYVLGRTRSSRYRAAKNQDLAVFPIATPLLAGPGSISVVVLLVNPPYGPLTTFVVISVNVLIGWLVLYLSPLLNRFLGSQGISVVSKIMGLIVGAIAVGLIREGISDAVKTLVGQA